MDTRRRAKMPDAPAKRALPHGGNVFPLVVVGGRPILPLAVLSVLGATGRLSSVTQPEVVPPTGTTGAFEKFAKV